MLPPQPDTAQSVLPPGSGWGVAPLPDLGSPAPTAFKLPRFPLDNPLPMRTLCVVIALPNGKSSPAGPRLVAAVLALIAAGCSLTYVQGPDHQRLDVEIMRPINVNDHPAQEPPPWPS